MNSHLYPVQFNAYVVLVKSKSTYPVRFFYSFGASGQVLTSWSLAGALVLNESESHEIYEKLSNKGISCVVRHLIVYTEGDQI